MTNGKGCTPYTLQKKQQINYFFLSFKKFITRNVFFFSFFKDIISTNSKFKEVKCLIAAPIEIYSFFPFSFS